MELRSRALELLASYDGVSLTFTDGSKSNEGAGCAFVAHGATRSFSLPADASVFTTELAAIIKALSFIEVGDEASHLILSDSLSSLLALRGFYPRHPLVQDILLRVTSLYQAGKSVEFCWLPSHVGITGNELADAAARRASSAQCTRRFPLPAADLFPAISRFVHSQWQQLWDAQQNSKLRAIKPALSRWLSSSRRSRTEEVALCRLRIGHTYATHGYLLCGGDRPECTHCGESLTVAHVLLTCRRLSRKRSHHLGYISPTVTLLDLLGDDSRWVLDGTLFSFIRSVSFLVTFHS